MAYTQTQIDALRRAISSGVREVQHENTRTVYRSLAEMKAVLAEMENEVNSKPRRAVGKFSNGTF